MNLFGWLMGGTKTASKVVDAVINTGDKLVYTDEEKAEARQKTREWFLEYLKATQPQNVSRRFIALIIVGLWAVFVLSAAILHITGYAEQAEFLFKVLAENINNPFLVVVGFYFAAHVVRNMKS